MVDVHLVITDRLPAGTDARAEVDPLVAACADLGIEATPVRWNDDSVDWSAAPLTVIRATWDYFDHPDEFVAWGERVRSVTQLQNPWSLVRWNMHKRYLIDLAAAGFPVIPTRVVGPDRDLELPDGPELIAKPVTGGGARGTFIGLRSDQAFIDRIHQEAEQSELVVQPLIESIRDQGETSVLCIDNEVVNATRKVPAAGDFRVHEVYGGTFTRIDPPGPECELAQRLVGYVAPRGSLLYGRVDTVRIDDRPHLMELEIIEPAFYLELNPAIATAFAQAVQARLP
ncbi:MAG: ATP-grasp domain-containing protein [Acidimicrobiia bacterium]